MLPSSVSPQVTLAWFLADFTVEATMLMDDVSRDPGPCFVVHYISELMYSRDGSSYCPVLGLIEVM